MKVYVLNALPLNTLPKGFNGQISVREADPEGLFRNEAMKKVSVVSYVRHPATARLIGYEPCAGLADLQPGDVAIILTLRNPQRGQEVETIDWPDLRAWLVRVGEDKQWKPWDPTRPSRFPKTWISKTDP